MCDLSIDHLGIIFGIFHNSRCLIRNHCNISPRIRILLLSRVRLNIMAQFQLYFRNRNWRIC